jgi:membrane-associated protein
MISVDFLLPLLIEYKYLILFPSLMFGGPAVTLFASFLASPAGGGVFVVSFLYIVVFIADITTDTLYYSIGRWGKNLVDKLSSKNSASEHITSNLEKFYKEHGEKTIVIAKITHGLGWPAMMAAGSAKMPYLTFIRVSILVSLIKSTLLIAIGYYYGQSYAELSKYISQTSLTITSIIVFGVVIYLFSINRKNKILNQ